MRVLTGFPACSTGGGIAGGDIISPERRRTPNGPGGAKRKVFAPPGA